MPKTSKKVRVLLVLEPRHAKLLDAKCGGPRESRTPGPKNSGRAGWIRKLIFKELGIREEQDELGILDRINLDVLTDVEKLVVQMVQDGTSVPDVIRFLADEQIRPERGRKWYPHQIEALINLAAAKSYKWLLEQIEEGTEKTSQKS